MDSPTPATEKETPVIDIAKYRIAAYVFLAMNLLYLVVFFIFLPSFHMDASTLGMVGVYVALFAWFTWMIHGGRRKFTLVMAVIYGVRIGLSTLQLIRGEAFEAVIYTLPCIIIAFYFLGRAVWNWK